MRLGTVIGRITLTQQEPVYTGGCLLLVQPWTRAQFADHAAEFSSGLATPPSRVAAPVMARSARKPVQPALPLPPGNTLVVYDALGAGQGSVIGFSEGAEAAQPFTGDAPVDAYCTCILDQLSYTPPRATSS